MSGRPLALAAALLLGFSAAAAGQVYGGGDRPRKGTVEVAGGGTWAGGFDTGSSGAELTRSGRDAPPYELFTTAGEVSGFPGAHARVGFFLSRSVSVEGGIRYARPRLSYRLSDDAESAADETATETLTSYVFDGSVLLHFPGASFGGGRGLPFVSGGAGYIRELHDGNELLETGTELHATGGVKYWFGSPARFGLRAEVGVSVREKGLDPEEDGRRTLPMALAGVTVLF